MNFGDMSKIYLWQYRCEATSTDIFVRTSGFSSSQAPIAPQGLCLGLTYVIFN